MSRGAGLLALVAATLALTPATAAAAELCVGMPDDCPGSNKNTIGEAIGELAAGDTLYLGSDTFDLSEAIDDADVQIVGSGPDATTITGSRTRLLELSGADTVVRDLTIQASGANQTGLFTRGIAANVHVTAPTPRGGMTGIEFGPSTATQLLGSKVTFGDRATVPTVGVKNRGAALTIEDSDIVAARGLDLAVTDGTTTARRIEVTAPEGVLLQRGKLFLGSSVLRAESVSPFGSASFGLLTEQQEGGDDEAQVSNVSIVGAGQYGLRAVSRPTEGIRKRVFLGDSIYLGPGFATAVSFERDTSDPFVEAFYDAEIRNVGVPSTYGDEDFETWIERPGGVQVNDGPPVWVPAAHMLDDAGDLRPRVGSPLIDAGATGPGPAWLLGFDFGAEQRVTDGDGTDGPVRDIGALEYQPQSPVVTATRSTASVAVGEAVTFNASATDETGDALTYAWSFDDGGTASGKVVSKSFASSGTHLAVVTVTDSTGRKGTASVSVSVTQPTTTTLDPLLVADPAPVPVQAPAPPTVSTPPGGTTAQSTVEAPRVMRTLGLGSLRSLHVRRGRVAVPVDCRPACKLRLVLESRGRTPMTLGSVSERVAKAGARTLSVKLTAAGARLLRRSARTVVTATLSTAGLAPKRRTATVLRA